jgi:hypothetical protein
MATTNIPLDTRFRHQMNRATAIDLYNHLYSNRTNLPMSLVILMGKLDTWLAKADGGYIKPVTQVTQPAAQATQVEKEQPTDAELLEYQNQIVKEVTITPESL